MKYQNNETQKQRYFSDIYINKNIFQRFKDLKDQDTIYLLLFVE